MQLAYTDEWPKPKSELSAAENADDGYELGRLKRRLTSAMSTRLFIGFDGVSIPAADALFISAAEIYGERVIDVVLSLRISVDRLEAEIVHLRID